MDRKEKLAVAMAFIATALAGALHRMEANVVLAFVVTSAALALLALIVGDATARFKGTVTLKRRL